MLWNLKKGGRVACFAGILGQQKLRKTPYWTKKTLWFFMGFKPANHVLQNETDSKFS